MVVYLPKYSEDLIIAVRWLLHKGVTRSSDIARRLEVSPYTIRNIKRVLKQRGEFPEEAEKGRKAHIRRKPKKKKKAKEDFITKMFKEKPKSRA